MSSNKSIVEADGTTPDWVELYNDSASDVDLSGYGISDSIATVRYYFPQGTVIRAGVISSCPATAARAKRPMQPTLAFPPGAVKRCI